MAERNIRIMRYCPELGMQYIVGFAETVSSARDFIQQLPFPNEGRAWLESVKAPATITETGNIHFSSVVRTRNKPTNPISSLIDRFINFKK